MKNLRLNPFLCFAALIINNTCLLNLNKKEPNFFQNLLWQILSILGVREIKLNFNYEKNIWIY